jgi:hypothetical protein
MCGTNLRRPVATFNQLGNPCCPLLALSGHPGISDQVSFWAKDSNPGVRGSPQNDLSSHDVHRDATLVFFFFLSVAATPVFFLPVAANGVDFLALLACCT